MDETKPLNNTGGRTLSELLMLLTTMRMRACVHVCLCICMPSGVCACASLRVCAADCTCLTCTTPSTVGNYAEERFLSEKMSLETNYNITDTNASLEFAKVCLCVYMCKFAVYNHVYTFACIRSLAHVELGIVVHT